MEQAETCFVLRTPLDNAAGAQLQSNAIVYRNRLHGIALFPGSSQKKTEALFIEKRGCSSGPKLITRRDLKQ